MKVRYPKKTTDLDFEVICRMEGIEFIQVAATAPMVMLWKNVSGCGAVQCNLSH